MDFDLIDRFEKVTDRDAAVMTRRIAREEGIFAGNSAGSAVAGLLQLGEHLRKEDVVVVIFHDHGTRYLGKMFNDDWMRERGFLASPVRTAADWPQDWAWVTTRKCARSRASRASSCAVPSLDPSFT